MIPGIVGILEARYHSSSSRLKSPIAIIVPPHPEHDGTMDHPIVHTLFRMFASLKFNVLRFNFRGCGRSQGVFTNGEGEILDSACCLDWLQSQNSVFSQCWVAGFSFGAYVALQLLMRRPECHSFIAINPPANLYDFSFLAPCPAPGLVIHGESNNIVPKESVIKLVHHLSIQRRGHKITFHSIPKADHHFSNHLPTLENLSQQYIEKELQILKSDAKAL
jgi:alpha/beta superfamily hydrolase